MTDSGAYPIELRRRTPEDRLAFLTAKRPELAAAGWNVHQLALIDRMIAEARADVTRGHGLPELAEAINRAIAPDAVELGRERRRQDEIASGQLRPGARWTWYASIRWSDEAWRALHPLKLEQPRWTR